MIFLYDLSIKQVRVKRWKIVLEVLLGSKTLGYIVQGLGFNYQDKTRKEGSSI